MKIGGDGGISPKFETLEKCWFFKAFKATFLIKRFDFMAHLWHNGVAMLNRGEKYVLL